MNCKEARSLLLASRDGPLPSPGADALASHVADCPGCRRLKADLGAGFDDWARQTRTVSVPAADEVWRGVRAAGQRRTAPVRPAWVRLGLPLAAAAAFALVLLQAPWRSASPPVAASELAHVIYVVPGTPGASTLVYEDSESGWLVVWTSESEPI